MTTFDDVLRWNIGQLATLIPIGLFGLIFIFANRKLPLIACCLAHFGVTCLVYYSHGDPPHSDDFLGCLAYPFLIAFPAGLIGMAVLLGQAAFQSIQRRRAAKPAPANEAI